jgi:hypothetical protein
MAPADRNSAPPSRGRGGAPPCPGQLPLTVADAGSIGCFSVSMFTRFTSLPLGRR